MYDQEGDLKQYYFDIVKSVGVNDDGIPFFDDLYIDIDVVVLPDGELYILDEDELDEAYRNHAITIEEYEFAKSTTSKLVANMREGSNHMINAADKYYRLMRGFKRDI
jgi:hypothetical protein